MGQQSAGHWVVIYSHKFGIDVGVYHNAKDAEEAAINIVKEYRKDFDIDEKMSDIDVLNNWDELTHGTEWIDVTQPTLF